MTKISGKLLCAPHFRSRQLFQLLPYNRSTFAYYIESTFCCALFKCFERSKNHSVCAPVFFFFFFFSFFSACTKQVLMQSRIHI